MELLVASLVFLFRFEMYAFAFLIFLLPHGKKEWRLLPLVLVGPALWIGSSALISGDVFMFFKEWAHFSGLGKFIPGVTVTHYLEHLQTIFGFLQVACFCVGIILITGARRHREFAVSMLQLRGVSLLTRWQAPRHSTGPRASASCATSR